MTFCLLFNPYLVSVHKGLPLITGSGSETITTTATTATAGTSTTAPADSQYIGKHTEI